VDQDAIVIGPFTKELGDPFWLENELARIGATVQDVSIRVIYVFLASEEAYRERLQGRGSALDVWKLDNWQQFRSSLKRKEVTWRLEPLSLLHWDNSEQMTEVRVAELEAFIMA
jgi:hypothetical protein